MVDLIWMHGSLEDSIRGIVGGVVMVIPFSFEVTRTSDGSSERTSLSTQILLSLAGRLEGLMLTSPSARREAYPSVRSPSCW